MEMKKAVINNKIYEVIQPDEYAKMNGVYDMSSVAVEFNGLLYPITTNSKVPGLYNVNNCFSKYVDPSDDERDKYSTDNIINFEANNMKQVIETSQMLKSVENEILSTPDKIFIPSIKSSDEPELAALKQAIINKNIDFDKYEQRIGSTFTNDKRLFSSKYNSISLPKLKSLSDALDIKVTLILEDKEGDIANPMNDKIIVELTGDGGNE